MTFSAACRIGLRSYLPVLLFCSCAISGLALPTQAAGSPRQVMFEQSAVLPRVAVIYDERDEYENGAYADILRGLGESRDVMVFRVALNSVGQETQMAAAASGSFIKLAATGVGNVAVLYPDIGEPFRSVFSKIIEGVEDRTKSRVVSYAVGPNMNIQDLSGELRKQDVRVVIALGRNGLKAANSLDRDNIGVVAGGVLAVPESDARGISVFSLAPDPGLLMSRLKAMAPQIKRVHVIYDPKQNGWLISLARDAARSHGLELVAQEAGDLKSALGLYQAWLANADPKRDALWLPQDSTTVEESTVLPLVLQESWNRNLTVFSSSLGHVKRGALFSLYPNNLELGRNLAGSALNYLNARDTSSRGLLPLREVLVAVNIRTAGHLGLDLGYKSQQTFDMVFPEP